MRLLESRYSLFTRISIILLFIIVVFLLFPTERKFRYEFQKGKPWQHDDLIAPFKFPVYKLDEEYKRELDSIKQSIQFYFVYQNQVLSQVLDRIKQDYTLKIRQLIKEDSAKRAKDLFYKRTTPPPDLKKYNQYFEQLLHLLTFVYDKGILETSDIADLMRKYPDYSLVIYRDNLVKNYDFDQVFTTKKAYTYLLDELDKLVHKFPKDKPYIDFLKNMDLENYIQPNLAFDLDKTMALKQKALRELSKTRGAVQAGELIIARGQIVSDEQYRILLSLKRVYEKGENAAARFLINLGNFLIITIIYFTFVLFIYNYKPEILNELRDIVFIFSLITFFISGVIIAIRFTDINIYILPLALLPIIIKVFYDERLALFSHLTAIFIAGFIAPNSFEFVIMQFVSGFAAIFSLTQLSRRGQLYISVAAVFLSLSSLYLGIALIQEGNLSNIRWTYFLFFALNSLLLLLAYPLIYAFERIFGLISDVTLIELLNTNQPLLYKLSTQAPGTFQHSLQVANLSEAAAKELRANALLTRVGALYHDIGKLYAPQFFIENQHGYNPHDNLEFDQSAKIIIDHVSRGLELANKYGLPEQIKDFIRTHHGTTTVQYFYKNYIKKYPDKANEIDKFRYPGPKPFSKETAIVMMADSLEAASRSLQQYTQETIENLVEKIINHQLEERQFDEADLTFKEISKLKKLFTEQLLTIYHTRIAYPE